MSDFRYIQTDPESSANSFKKLSDRDVDPDAKLLGKVASKVRRAVIDEDLAERNRGRGADLVEASDTGGYVASLGSVSRGGSAELWLCRFPKAGHRVLSVCVTYFQKRGHDTFGNIKAHFPKTTRTLNMKMVAHVRAEFSQLKKKLPTTAYGTVLAEDYYPEGSLFFTVYIAGKVTTKNVNEFSEKALNHLRDLLSQVEEAEHQAYERVASTSAQVKTHTAHEYKIRNSGLARAAKTRDKYRCVACGLQPEKLFGAKVGACLEAHHMVTMASKKVGQRDRLDDLVTLCPNCHKAVHALFREKPGLAAVKWVKARVQKMIKRHPSGWLAPVGK